MSGHSKFVNIKKKKMMLQKEKFLPLSDVRLQLQ